MSKIDNILKYAKKELENLKKKEFLLDINENDENIDTPADSLVEEILSKDATAFIKISDNDMKAELTITPAIKSGKTIEIEDVNKILLEHNIIWGIDFDKINNLIEKVKTSKKKICETIAIGKPPVNGNDAYFIEEYKKNKPIPKNSKNRIDHREFNKIYSVEKDDVILKKVNATNGANGVNIKGKKIKALSGKDIIYTASTNVYWDSTTNEFKASCNGKIDINDRIITVTPMFHINGDIDMSVGNIDFNGDVIIEGSVLDDFSVRSSKNIEVFGKVYAANLNANGNITIHKGFIGRNKGLIISKKNVSIEFIENGNVEAEEDIIVKKTIMHSNLNAGGKIYIEKEKSSIIGGTIYATKGLVAYNIGNSMEVRTNIIIGKNKTIEKEIEKLSKRSDFFIDSITKLKNIIVKVIGHNIKITDLTKEQQNIIKPISAKIKNYNNEIKNIRKNLDELNKELTIDDNIYLKVKGDIFPGVNLIIGETYSEIKRTFKYSTFSEDRENNKFIITSFN